MKDDLNNLIDVLLGSDRVFGLMVLGETGIGKSFATTKYLDDNKVNYNVLRTYTTPLSLYMWLYEHRDEELVVMDDVDGIWENDHAAAIMKSALWEDDKERRIEWHSSSKILSKSGTPFEFAFNSKIIFICNKTRDNPHVDAVLSRVLHYKISYTRKEKLEEMRNICEQRTGSNLDKFEKLEVVTIIDKFASLFDFRTLIHGFAIMEHCKLKEKGDWKSVFMTVLMGDTNKEIKLVYDLSKQGISMDEQVRQFTNTTGLSRRTYFRYKRRLKDSGCL